MTPLSLTASKKIADLGVEVVAEKWWGNNSVRGAEWWVSEYNPNDPRFKFPAPNLQELLTALPSIGEKLGKRDYRAGVEYDANGSPIGWEPLWKDEFAHRLTDLYLSGGIEAVSEEVERLLAKE